MHRTVRDNVPTLTGVLTVVSLALVFGAVLGYLPASALPRLETLVALVPHLNAAVSLLAIVSIVYGVRAIRQGDVASHRAAMLTTTALFATFLVLYLYRVTLEGPSAFAGPPAVERFVYLPTLAIHILLAIAAIPFVYYTLLLAATRPASALPETNHARVGRVAATLWVVSFTLGIVVYLLLHVLF